ncbi:MAG: aldo/keto reductase [Actinobacteria bacterium]|nr:aldo/keto reductase [Actinomycetota bacterium]
MSLSYLAFGRRTGLRVSEFALGTSNFGTAPSARTDLAEARRIVDAYAAAGGNFIDTADAYQGGTAEEVLGEVLAGRRDEFVLATKFTRTPGPRAGSAATGNSRLIAVRSLEASLRRLRTDHVDIYWVHLPDGVTPVEEILATFDDLIRSGKIRYGGLSNFPAWRVAAAATLDQHHGPGTALIGIQDEYSLAHRPADADLIPAAEAFGLGACLYAPLAGGLLTAKYRAAGAEGRYTAWGAGVRTEDSAQHTAILDSLVTVAGELDTTPARAAVAWLAERARRSATALVPVIGPRTLTQLEDYLAGLAVPLTPAQYARLTEVSAVTAAPDDSIAFGGQPARFRRPPVPVV